MGMDKIPLLEFDNDRTALIEPSTLKSCNLPEHCIIIFYNSVIQRLKQDQLLEKIHEIKSVLQTIEVFKLKQGNRFLAVVCPTGCGAPLAGSLLEELIALGCRKFVACGGAGVLKSELNRGAVVVPNAAIRDEGMSYHYLPPSRTVEANPAVIQKLVQVLENHGVPYEVGRTWTTDAFFRETKGKIAERKMEGCLTVEMECSALLAIAKFRNVLLGQYLLAGDDCGGTEWDQRLQDDLLSAPLKMFWLSVEACLTL
jgi:uridine phosphorylase